VTGGNATRNSTVASFTGSAAFDRIDKDHAGTVDHSELDGRLSAKEMAAEHSDTDNTLDKVEYLALVEQRFKVADRDNDGTVDAGELNRRPVKRWFDW
jgi:Ca2+-binding EF-hand superfamily protein